jgi:hypothetical protein
MKYEAKCVALSDLTTGLTAPNTGTGGYDNSTTACTSANSKKPASTASGYPIVNITQADAATMATKACSGCHLITEAEWLTIAQNILNNASNWDSGSPNYTHTVGTGYVYSGHNDNSPASALVADSNDANGYSGTGNASHDLTLANGMRGNTQQRTLTLSNGQVIWDLSGNVSERTSAQTAGNQPGAVTGYATFQEWSAVAVMGSLSPSPFPAMTGISGAGTWNSANGIGKLSSKSDDTILKIFTRSGYWNDNTFAGILALYLGSAPSSTGAMNGFRVTR